MTDGENSLEVAEHVHWEISLNYQHFEAQCSCSVFSDDEPA